METDQIQFAILLPLLGFSLGFMSVLVIKLCLMIFKPQELLEYMPLTMLVMTGVVVGVFLAIRVVRL